MIVLLSHGQINDVWLSPRELSAPWAALRLYKAGYAPSLVGSSLRQGAISRSAGEMANEAGARVAILIERRSSRTIIRRRSCPYPQSQGWHRTVIVTSELDVPKSRCFKSSSR